MPKPANPRRGLAFSAVFLATILYGCGQSGPLYLPGNPSEVQVPPQAPAASSPTSEEDDEDEAHATRSR